ncbi:MAG: response regulator [SAR324 cluster bacterium]|uniref:Response regulator n=1 Tax=SAR324 cluster bacterium TaxID=2024889 RepID=A0A7X9IJ98_9DELT|nr:response regulator [SAR324 cluster bacterium]
MEKILIIDDDKINSKIIARIVEDLGLVALQCANGKQGWEALCENDDIAYVLTDMLMPDMDGRELVYLIRYHEKFKDLPVLVISGVFSSEELGGILEISPSNTFFLAKPVDANNLRTHIEKLRKARATEGKEVIQA